MGIALEIHRVSREAVRDHGPGRLDAVRVAVGELSAVEPDLLSYAWEALTAEGPDAGARLEVVWCPADQRCQNCGEVKQRGEGSWLRLCPDCGMPLELRGGEELDVLEVTYIADADTRSDDDSGTEISNGEAS
jgi:hydrogenase nickel incorporation protein HypA/HybF